MSQLLLPLLLVLVLAVPLVMSSRKQKKQQAAQQELMSSLAPGDRVMTTSGLYGTVADASGDNTIDIEIAPGVVTTWLRIAVREKVSDPSTGVITDEVDDVDDDEDIDETELHDAEPASTAQVAPSLEESSKKAR